MKKIREIDRIVDKQSLSSSLQFADKDIEQDHRLDRIESISVIALELKKSTKKR